jgi:AcrR family transcriptional regulator
MNAFTALAESSPDRRTELLARLAGAAIADRSGPVSLRQFAIQAGVSEPTLRHFFKDRRGVVIALLGFFAGQAADFLARSAVPRETVRDAVQGYGALAGDGFSNALFAQAHGFALVEAIHDPVVARAYLDTVIEPSLKAIEARLAPSADPEGRDPERVRHAALALYAATLFAILHQRLLGGGEARPLDAAAFLADITALFADGLGPKG